MHGKGERLEGRARDLVQSGDAVIETSRGLVFARGALPGERVLVSLDGKPGRVLRGKLISVLESAGERVEPPCALAARCGGCPMMHASLATQRAFKQRFLREALAKAGAPEELEVAVRGNEETLGYRRRARLAFHVSERARELGYRRERSREVVDVPACVVLAPPLQEALHALRVELLPKLTGAGELSLALGRDGRAVCVVRAEGPQPPEAYAACERLVRQFGSPFRVPNSSDSEGVAAMRPGTPSSTEKASAAEPGTEFGAAVLVANRALLGLALYAAGATKPARFGEPAEWSNGADGLPLEGTVGGFSQAHAGVNRALALRVAELARTEGMRVLELYAGHGNLSVLLARGAASYTAVERDPAASAALRRNLSSRGLKAKVVEADAAGQLGAGPLDVLVLDPPRSGAKAVLSAAAARKPKRIIYVSCDPATLARDLKEALASGYYIASAEVFDMFPQTADLESVVALERA